MENCQCFSPEEENKFEYTAIFNQYIAEIEQFIADNLIDVNLEEFLMIVPERLAEIDESLLETLLSFTNFEIFKELMLNYKCAEQLCVYGTNQLVIQT